MADDMLSRWFNTLMQFHQRHTEYMQMFTRLRTMVEVQSNTVRRSVQHADSFGGDAARVEGERADATALVMLVETVEQAEGEFAHVQSRMLDTCRDIRLLLAEELPIDEEEYNEDEECDEDEEDNAEEEHNEEEVHDAQESALEAITDTLAAGLIAATLATADAVAVTGQVLRENRETFDVSWQFNDASKAHVIRLLATVDRFIDRVTYAETYLARIDREMQG